MERAKSSNLSYTNLNLPEAWENGWVRFNFGADFQSVPGVTWLR